MASGQTENFELNQWAENDPVLRQEFNADNAKIDATMPKIVAGSYTGDGEAVRVISLGFTPRLVFLCSSSGTTYTHQATYTNYFGGLITPELPGEANGITYFSITEGGFQVIYKPDNSGATQTTSYTGNSPNAKYRYWAVK